MALNQSYYGYDFRRKAPCITVRRTVKTTSAPPIANIDRWLTEVLQIAPEQIGEFDGERASGEAAGVAKALGRGLALYGELGRACGFPSFDAGKVLAVDVGDEPGSYSADIALPVIDTLPRQLFERLFGNSLRIVFSLFCQAPTKELAESLFATLDTSILKPIRQSVPLGSSVLDIASLAASQDVPFRYVGSGMTRIGWGAKARLFYGSSVDCDSAVGIAICQNKHVTANLLRTAGFPTPPHLPVDSPEAALAAARTLGWPVVVKPADRERSIGVTTGITSAEALGEAYDKARALSRQILVERHVPGWCHRITVARDRIVYAVKRTPKRVRGNGRDTIEELVAAANAALAAPPPWRRLKPLPLDEITARVLADAGLTLRSVPAEGQWVPLRSIPSSEWGGDIENLTATIHPDNARLAIEATRAIGLAVGGVDLMTVDLTVPWHENGAVINEMNARPQFTIRNREDDAGALLPVLIEGDGRIPVHFVTGEGDLLARARELRGELTRQGRRCHITMGDRTEDPSGATIVMDHDRLFARSLALISRPDVEELILAGAPSEADERGFAVDRLESVHIHLGDHAEAERVAAALASRVVVGALRMPVRGN